MLSMDIIVGTEIAETMESMAIIVIAAINSVPALLSAKPLRSCSATSARLIKHQTSSKLQRHLRPPY
jgi:hypothetical protein